MTVFPFRPLSVSDSCPPHSSSYFFSDQFLQRLQSLLLQPTFSSSCCRCISCSVGMPRLSSERPGVWRQQGLRLPYLAAAQCWWSLTCGGLLCRKVSIGLNHCPHLRIFQRFQIYNWIQMNEWSEINWLWEWKFILELGNSSKQSHKVHLVAVMGHLIVSHNLSQMEFAQLSRK